MYLIGCDDVFQQDKRVFICKTKKKKIIKICYSPVEIVPRTSRTGPRCSGSLTANERRSANDRRTWVCHPSGWTWVTSRPRSVACVQVSATRPRQMSVVAVGAAAETIARTGRGVGTRVAGAWEPSVVSRTPVAWRVDWEFLVLRALRN